MSFHSAETCNRKIKNPTEYVTLENTLDLPNIEEVDSLPSFTLPEHVEAIKLEELGGEILNKMYAIDIEPSKTIKCKGVSREEYRF